MRTTLPSNFGLLTSTDKQAARYQTAQNLQVMGTNTRPQPPGSIVAQSGARKALVTWRKPDNSNDITGWRIYKHTENNRIDSIDDPSVTQTEVTLDSGATPPVVNIFVSSVNARGLESQKVQVQCSAIAEGSAPSDPTPPPGNPPPPPDDEPPPGFGCFTPNAEVKTVFGPIRMGIVKDTDLVVIDGKIRRIRKTMTHDYDGELYRIPFTDWGVTPAHEFRVEGKWKRAEEIFVEKFYYKGIVCNLEIDEKNFDDQCYELSNRMVAHNKRA